MITIFWKKQFTAVLGEGAKVSLIHTNPLRLKEAPEFSEKVKGFILKEYLPAKPRSDDCSRL